MSFHIILLFQSFEKKKKNMRKISVIFVCLMKARNIKIFIDFLSNDQECSSVEQHYNSNNMIHNIMDYFIQLII